MINWLEWEAILDGYLVRWRIVVFYGEWFVECVEGGVVTVGFTCRYVVMAVLCSFIDLVMRFTLKLKMVVRS